MAKTKFIREIFGGMGKKATGGKSGKAKQGRTHGKASKGSDRVR